MSSDEDPPPRLPPRWFIRSFWRAHRLLCRVTGARMGLSRPRPGAYGMLRLHTLGRRSGQQRAVILAYYEDGADLVLMAMNGWDEPPPGWWLNLLAHPEATVDVVGGTRPVRAREATDAERARLWDGWRAHSRKPEELDALARQRSRPTPVVVLEPRS